MLWGVGLYLLSMQYHNPNAGSNYHTYYHIWLYSTGFLSFLYLFLYKPMLMKKCLVNLHMVKN